MKTHNLTQGTPEWNAHRAMHFNASDAPAMMGESKYKTRDELIREIATGLTAEVDTDTQKRFDNGHAAEALARPLAEQIIGEELYPVVGSLDRYSASFDGLTIAGDVAFEHKSLNDEIRACQAAADLHPMYRIQMEQQLMISGAGKCLFMGSKWNGGELVEEKHFWYVSDPKLRADILAGWEQFAEDLKNYQHVEVLPPTVAEPVMALPALSIQVNGSIALQSNLELFGAKLKAFIEGIDKNPSDDQAFANAEAAVKTLQIAQDTLEAAEKSALAQTASIDDMRRTVALYSDLARTTRLTLERLVKARKETIRVEIVQSGRDALKAHIAAMDRLSAKYMPAIPENFAGVIKGKKTITSLREAVNTEIARCKIEANNVGVRIRKNLDSLMELAKDHAHLFADTAQIVLKDNDDLIALVKNRMAEYAAAEQKKADDLRAQIQREEEAKARAAVVPTPQPAQIPAQSMPSTVSTGMTGTGPVIAKPKLVSSPTGPRPTDGDIIKVVASHFKVSESKALQWLLDMDMDAALERLADQEAV